MRAFPSALPVFLLALLAFACAGPGGEKNNPGPDLTVSRLADLESDEPALRFEAVQALLEGARSPDALRRLAAASPSSRARAWVVFILARTGASIDLPAFLSDPSPEVRYRAAEAASVSGRMNDRAVRDKLDLLLDDDDPMVRIAAAWAILSSFPDARARDVLINGLSRNSRTFAAREAALRLIDLYGPLVDFDAARGYTHQDMARQVLAVKLAGLPEFAAIPAWFPATDPPPPEATLLHERLEQAGAAAPGSSDLSLLWKAAVDVESRHPQIIKERLAVLEFLLDRIYNEGFLHADAALTYLNAGRTHEALMQYRRAVSLLPGDAALRNDFGIALEAGGWDDEAEAAYRQSAELDPGDEVPLLNLGHLFFKQGRIGEAEEILLAAERLAPDRWPYHRALLGRIVHGEAVVRVGE